MQVIEPVLAALDWPRLRRFDERGVGDEALNAFLDERVLPQVDRRRVGGRQPTR